MLQREFINRFNKLSDRIADVCIKHLLYGNQKIKKCVLHPISDGDRIGLIINGEDIYIKMNELSTFYMCDKKCTIESAVMEIHISL